MKDGIAMLNRQGNLRWLPVFLILILSGCMVLEKQPAPNADQAVSRRIAAGIEYLQMGKPVDARRHFARAVELEPRSPEAHNAMALLYKFEGDTKREEEHYRLAIRYNRDFAAARNNYGTLLFQQRRFPEALREFTRAADTPAYESRAIAFENKGRTLMALDRQEEAIEALNMSLRLDSRATSPLLELAAIHFQRNEMRLADHYYRRYADMISRQSARGLWLGIRMAAKQQDGDRLGSYELALDQMYAGTAEHREWQAWVQRGRR